MSKRLVVTGGGGFVGGSVLWQAGPEWDVHVISGKEPLLAREHMTWHRMDLLDAAALDALWASVRPDAVVHLAALADIDYCQAHPEEARALNALLPESLASRCAKTGARLVHVSTDTVFDGTKGMYTEGDAPGPLNVYAETKVAGELAVRSFAPGSAVVRLSLVMGLPMLAAGNSFLSRMLPVLRAGGELGVPDNELRTPLDVVTAGRALLELAGNDFSGYLHLAGNERLDRCALVRRIARHMGLDEGLVKPKNPEQIPGRAPRPVDASLSNELARRVLCTPMQDLEPAIDLIMETGLQ